MPHDFTTIRSKQYYKDTYGVSGREARRMRKEERHNNFLKFCQNNNLTPDMTPQINYQPQPNPMGNMMQVFTNMIMGMLAKQMGEMSGKSDSPFMQIFGELFKNVLTPPKTNTNQNITPTFRPKKNIQIQTPQLSGLDGFAKLKDGDTFELSTKLKCTSSDPAEEVTATKVSKNMLSFDRGDYKVYQTYDVDGTGKPTGLSKETALGPKHKEEIFIENGVVTKTVDSYVASSSQAADVNDLNATYDGAVTTTTYNSDGKPTIAVTVQPNGEKSTEVTRYDISGDLLDVYSKNNDDEITSRTTASGEIQTITWDAANPANSTIKIEHNGITTEKVLGQAGYDARGDIQELEKVIANAPVKGAKKVTPPQPQQTKTGLDNWPNIAAGSTFELEVNGQTVTATKTSDYNYNYSEGSGSAKTHTYVSNQINGQTKTITGAHVVTVQKEKSKTVTTYDVLSGKPKKVVEYEAGLAQDPSNPHATYSIKSKRTYDDKGSTKVDKRGVITERRDNQTGNVYRFTWSATGSTVEILNNNSANETVNLGTAAFRTKKDLDATMEAVKKAQKAKNAPQPQQPQKGLDLGGRNWSDIQDGETVKVNGQEYVRDGSTIKQDKTYLGATLTNSFYMNADGTIKSPKSVIKGAQMAEYAEDKTLQRLTHITKTQKKVTTMHPDGKTQKLVEEYSRAGASDAFGYTASKTTKYNEQGQATQIDEELPRPIKMNGVNVTSTRTYLEYDKDGKVEIRYKYHFSSSLKTTRYESISPQIKYKYVSDTFFNKKDEKIKEEAKTYRNNQLSSEETIILSAQGKSKLYKGYENGTLDFIAQSEPTKDKDAPAVTEIKDETTGTTYKMKWKSDLSQSTIKIDGVTYKIVDPSFITSDKSNFINPDYGRYAINKIKQAIQDGHLVRK